ncbi:MAG TPA: cytochrome c [Vicinamibacterales bacterium]|nr:cytochrome c [Vicinamibacterales bacterium]
MTVASGRWTQVVGAMAVGVAICAGAAVTSSAQEPAAAASASVWSAVYTEEQAKRGEVVSKKLCTSCHGPDLSGGEAGPALVGLEFLGNWNALSAGDFFDRVRSTMPADAPGTMTPQQTSDVAAYVLRLNKYPAGTTELPTDLAALKKITIESQPPAK